MTSETTGYAGGYDFRRSSFLRCIKAEASALPIKFSVLSKRHRRPGDQNDRKNRAHKCRGPYDCQQLSAEFLLRRLADQRSASHADSRSHKRNAQHFP
ncbi:MAG: hypothetical protein ACLUNZ_11075 [Evtepia sp.]